MNFRNNEITKLFLHFQEGEAANQSQPSTGQIPEGSQAKSSCTEAKKKKNRCAVCRKKVGLTGESKCKFSFRIGIFFNNNRESVIIGDKY